ncbi:hypothetical protein GCK72_007828 [Caenorhabditis remanei]|uniref:BTB domain-containing protein n=1 Tax=Caenorhabditis remanei TaxID=31234 RepID=A0A6A5HK41_CAERE|nr:hypothetical protein GCK72_007828 [Caenorhabditis remanei]KAF1767869.1 hypothetical protein GCK72_007828 [Caenorhabditis remanei]
MRKEVLDRQKDLEKSNLEIIEKLRLSDEKYEKLSNDVQSKLDKIIEALKPEASSEIVEKIRLSDEKIEKLSKEHQEKFDSIQSKLDKVVETLKPEVSSEILKNNDSTTSGKYFVLKHTFDNVSGFEYIERRFSEDEEHFGVRWRILMSRCDGFLNLCLWPLLLRNTEKKWEIEVEYELKIVSLSPREKKKKSQGKKVFKSDDTGSPWGTDKFIKWDELEKDFVVDDCFCVEIAVKVKKMTGIYKENLRSFDKTMEEYSDVVLIVDDQKFYVLKMILATDSPYFKNLFMEKSNETEKSEIQLSGIDADDFQNYLEVLYGKEAIDEFTVEGILMVAVRYATPVVIELCENFLQKKLKKTVKTKFQLSKRYNLPALMKQCVKEIK